MSVNSCMRRQSNKNDCEAEQDDDDNWDDWGDAEDNVDTVKTNDNVNESRGKNLTKQSVNQVNNNISREGQTNFTQTISNKSWGSMFGGVMSSVLNTASEGLGNITSTVTHGIDKVIGLPSPEELARVNIEESNQVRGDEMINNESSLFGLNLVTGVTTIGSKVINSGLDTLEGIGKKTMDILQESDPLLKDKIKKLAIESEKPNLSELLKQAKIENEHLEQSLERLTLERSKAQLRFDVLFENKCGLVHLEALEILSKEAQLKLDTIKDSVSGKALEEFLETTQEIKELLELEDMESETNDDNYNSQELEQKLKEAIEDAELNINFDDIINLWSRSLDWLNSGEALDNNDAYTMFSKSLGYLSETCALEIQKFHKIAELLLIKDHHSTANEVDAIIQLTKLFINHLQVLTNHFAGILSTKVQQKDDAENFISTLFSEMLLARQHVEKAFHLFLSILQIGAV